MRGRILALTLAVGWFADPVWAHNLSAECRFLPGRMVRVESWFSNGDVPKTGQVEVFDGDELLVKGRLSSQGLFLFDAPEGRPLKVVVDAGEGHRAEVPIKPEDVIVAQATGGAPPTPAEPAPTSRAEPFPVKDVLAGVGLLIAVAALVLSLRNARSISQIQNRSS
jgi:nickel transport protein